MSTENWNIVEFEIVNLDNDMTLAVNDNIRNWDDTERKIMRDLTNFGNMVVVSQNFEFVGESAGILRSAYEARDIEARVQLKEYRFHPQTDARYLRHTYLFDFSTYDDQITFISISFKTGGLNALIESKSREDYELTTTTSINGSPIDELIRKTVALTSRDIELISQLETRQQDSIIDTFRMRFGSNNYRERNIAVPLNINYRSDDLIATSVDAPYGENSPGLPTSVFYFNNDIDKVLSVSFTLKFTPTYRNISKISDEFFRVSLETYFNGTDLDILVSKRRILLEPTNVVQFFQDGNEQTITFNQNIELLAGESLGLILSGGARFGSGGLIPSAGRWDVDFTNVSCTLDVVEQSTRPNSQTEAVLVKDAGEKLMQILTGEKNRYFSDFYTNGEFKLTAITSGLWIRRFFDRNIKLSVDDFFQSTFSVHATGWTIDTIDGVETLVHENLSFFFQDFIATELPTTARILSRTPATDITYATIQAGYKKPSGDNLYEEVQGLDEPNVINNYGTPITRVDNDYDITSELRADANGKELARRERLENNPTGDTRYDNSNWFLDLKESPGTEVLVERVWQDDFAEAPRGVFSPDTITNLRLSPRNNLKRHGRILNAFLNKFQTENITFTGADGNANLETRVTGGQFEAERDNLAISDLDPQLFMNQIIEIEVNATFEVEQQLFGRSDVGNRSVPNYFGRVRFTNEYGAFEEGYILEATIDTQLTLRLLKSA